MVNGAMLGLFALGVAAALYIAGIVYAIRGEGQLAAVLIVTGAAFTLYGAG